MLEDSNHRTDNYTRYTQGRPDISLHNYHSVPEKTANRIRHLLFYPAARDQWKTRNAGTQTDSQAILNSEEQQHERNEDTITEISSFHQEPLEEIDTDNHTRYTPGRPDINLRNYCIANEDTITEISSFHQEPLEEIDTDNYTPGRPDINLRNYCIAPEKAASRIRHLLFYPVARDQWRTCDIATQTDLHEHNEEILIEIFTFHQRILEDILWKIDSTWNDLSDLFGSRNQSLSTLGGNIDARYNHCREADKEFIKSYHSFIDDPDYDTKKALKTFNESIDLSLHLLSNLFKYTINKIDNTFYVISHRIKLNEFRGVNEEKIEDMTESYRDAYNSFHTFYKENYTCAIESLGPKTYDDAYKYHNENANGVSERLNILLGTVDSSLQTLTELRNDLKSGRLTVEL